MMFHTPLSPIIYAKLLGSKLAGEYQPKITATGMLKGDGNGNVSAAVAGTDYDTASNIVSATSEMTPEQAAQTRQNIGADTPATVTAWLEEHVDPDTGYVIDNSLTIQGAAADAKATGDKIDIVKDFVYEEESVVLPTVIRSKCIANIDNASKIISGTENVAQLLNIAQGTFSVNDLTIVVSGNTISVNGTASKKFSFSLADGEEKTATQLAGMTLPLPPHDYTLSTKAISGSTPYPGLLVRSKVSGNVVSSQNNTASFTMDESTCGGLYLYFTKDAHYEFTYVIAVIPFAVSSVSPYRGQTSSVQEYTSSGVYDFDGYTWSVGTANVVALHSKLPSRPFCRYSQRTIAYSGMTECVDVYIPAETGYINYIFGHCIASTPAEEGGGNVWRLVQIDYVDENLAAQYHITALGETEMAIMLDGRDDFIGGISHGDEIMDQDSLLFVIDGKVVDITTFTSLTEFDTLQAFLVSDMYDPADHTTKVGEHGREWRFDADGLFIAQTVKFLENLSLIGSYMPMVCALRGNDTASALQITDTYIDDGNFQNYDVSVGGFTTYPNKLKNDVKQIHLLGKVTGLEITLNILEQPENLIGEGSFLFNGANTYNKIYNCICGYNNQVQSVSAGDKWHVKSQIKVTKK